ncbi:hypothetical protein HKBW3S34_02571 [Candidatus Hakubella thermalkaliphila]|uniref:Uncharacterized protein n=1 Tax=Candidatus Hakubella thermalkaliphila TaxID=2754717 RepID=A0A6V8PHR8_9ACTN|nr:hypothetical protein HKBW3S34_02571 [Candidatus Hakubella thermalkaliphila]
MGAYQKIATPERIFTNRFGMSIKEDILVLQMCGFTPQSGNARNIAR